ncbi:hypothetical protein H0H87_007212, partial [Tephrocybe sp. NHM501043]
EAYEPIHPPDAIITNLPVEKHIGAIDPAVVKVVKALTDEDKRRQALRSPKKVLTEKA